IFKPNTFVNIPVMLGTAAYPMLNLFGLGAELHLNGLTMQQPLKFTPFTTWLGTSALTYTRTLSNYQTDFVHTRYNQPATGGYGVLGYVTVHIPFGSGGDTATLYFDTVVMIDAAGNVLTDYNVIPDSFVVEDP